MGRKEEWVRTAPSEVLERIVNTLAGNEIKEKSPEFPLGGVVQMEGLGRIEVAAIRDELDRREGMKL